MFTLRGVAAIEKAPVVPAVVTSVTFGAPIVGVGSSDVSLYTTPRVITVLPFSAVTFPPSVADVVATTNGAAFVVTEGAETPMDAGIALYTMASSTKILARLDVLLMPVKVPEVILVFAGSNASARSSPILVPFTYKSNFCTATDCALPLYV